MKKSKAIISSLIAFTMSAGCVVGMVGCGEENNNNNNNNKPSGGSGDNYNITVWVSEVEGVKELTETQIAAFNASQSKYNFTATVEGVSESDSATKMIQDVESGADIFCFAQDQTARLVQAGALAEPGQAATNAIKEKNDAGAVKAATINDKVVAYPLTSDNGYFMFYDKTVITDESHLDSLELLIADCEAAKRNFAMELDTSAWYLASFFFAVGCHSNWTLDDTGKAIEVSDDWNSDAGVIAMQGVQKLEKSDYYVSSSAAKAFDAAIPAAVLVSGTWAVDDAEKILGDKLGYTDLPSFTVDNKSYHLGSYSGNKLMGVKPTKDAKKAAALQALALYLTDEACQLERFTAKGWGPSNLNAQQNEDVKANKPLAALAAQNQYATPQGTIAGEWWDIAKVLGTDAKGADLNDKAALKAALEKYDASLTAVVNKSDEEATVWSAIGSIYGDTWTVDYDLKEKAGVCTSAPIYLEAGTEFKVRQGHAWKNDTGAVSANPGACETLEGGNCKVTATGVYQIVYNTTDAKISLVEATFGVVGKINGTEDWNTDIAMTKVEGETVAFETAALTLAAGDEFKVRVGGEWQFDYGDGTANYKVTTAGSYKITLTLNAEHVWEISLVAA